MSRRSSLGLVRTGWPRNAPPPSPMSHASEPARRRCEARRCEAMRANGNGNGNGSQTRTRARAPSASESRPWPSVLRSETCHEHTASASACLWLCQTVPPLRAISHLARQSRLFSGTRHEARGTRRLTRGATYHFPQISPTLSLSSFIFSLDTWKVITCRISPHFTVTVKYRKKSFIDLTKRMNKLPQ